MKIFRLKHLILSACYTEIPDLISDNPWYLPSKDDITQKKLETLIDHPTLYKKYDGWFLLNFQPEEVQDDSRALVGKVVQKTPDSEIELITKEVSKLFRFNVLVKIVSN